MTTIAYKDGVIAYDSRCTKGETIVDDDFNKCKVVDGVAFFLCGSTADYDALIGMYMGRISAPAGACDSSALVHDNGELFECSYNKEDGFWRSPKRLSTHHALGSGTDHALTAMDMGANAEMAVKMAMKRDTGTGGIVRTFLVDANAS